MVTSPALAGLFFLGATDALEPKRLDLLRELHGLLLNLKSVALLVLEPQFVDQFIFGRTIGPRSWCAIDTCKAEMPARPLRRLIGSAHGCHGSLELATHSYPVKPRLIKHRG